MAAERMAAGRGELSDTQLDAVAGGHTALGNVTPAPSKPKTANKSWTRLYAPIKADEGDPFNLGT